MRFLRSADAGLTKIAVVAGIISSKEDVGRRDRDGCSDLRPRCDQEKQTRASRRETDNLAGHEGVGNISCDAGMHSFVFVRKHVLELECNNQNAAKMVP